MITLLRQIAARIRAHFGSSQLDPDLNDEFELHVAMAVEEHIRNGMTEEQAHRAAHLDLGGVASIVAMLCAVAGVAGYFPARRASRIDRMIVLRGN